MFWSDRLCYLFCFVFFELVAGVREGCGKVGDFLLEGLVINDLLLAEESYCFLLFVRTMKDHSAPLDNRRGRTSKV